MVQAATLGEQETGGAGAAPGYSGQLVRAEIKNLETKQTALKCMFNPTELSLSKAVKWDPDPQQGKGTPPVQFTGGNTPITLRVELLFDAYEQGPGGDVRKYTQELFKLAGVDSNTKDADTGQGRPARCQLVWGTFVSFPMVITNLDVRYVLFHPDGAPARAMATVSFQQCEADDVPKDQLAFSPSPTRGIPGQKLRLVKAGDAIHQIAWEEYKDPREWRHIAQVNGLDNPRDLRPGQLLVITPLGTRP